MAQRNEKAWKVNWNDQWDECEVQYVAMLQGGREPWIERTTEITCFVWNENFVDGSQGFAMNSLISPQLMKSFQNRSVIRWNLDVFQTARAAELRTSWRMFVCDVGRFSREELRTIDKFRMNKRAVAMVLAVVRSMEFRMRLRSRMW